MLAWKPWTAETFHEAATQDKLVFLTLWTTWERWCRAMDEESFGRPDIAAMLTEDFVPVRVDAQREPDVDVRYNLGGWPTVAFLTPQGQIIWGQTYLAPDSVERLLRQFKEGFRALRPEISRDIAVREEKIREIDESRVTGTRPLDVEIFHKTLNGILVTYDPLNGGFGRAPKLPMPASLEVLCVALAETGGEDFRRILCQTLSAMGDRGLYDAEEGGFFRYATSETWSTPHYEKLCEDNSLLASLFFDASELTGVGAKKATAVVDWIARKLVDAKTGQIFGSIAADEKYYTASPRPASGGPPIDQTVFTDAAAAAAGTFFKAWAFTGRARFRDLGIKALEFLAERMGDGSDGFFHYHDGRARKAGLLRDQIAMARLFLAAYEAVGSTRFLEGARRTCARLLEKYWDPNKKGVVDRLVADSDVGLLRTPIKDIDENGLLADTLARVGAAAREEGFLERARTIIENFPDYGAQYGHFTARYALAAARLLKVPIEATVVSPPGRPSEPLCRAANRAFDPSKIVRHETGGRPAVVVRRGNGRPAEAFSAKDAVESIRAAR